jgi:aldose 1-epimerase
MPIKPSILNMLPAKRDYFLAPKELLRENFQKMIGGRMVDLFTLQNNRGALVKITNYGAKVMQILLPTSAGISVDVALGYDNIDATLLGHASIGAFIGRYANRITNARFILENQEYQLDANSGENSLHGGIKGSRFQVFSAQQLAKNSLELSYTFRDGEEGFPGELHTTVIYCLNDNNELSIEWVASAKEKTTIANFTSHIFFNLSGDSSKTIEDHIISVNSEKYLVIDRAMCPTGEIANVEGSPFDFRIPKKFGKDIRKSNEQLQFGKGYDHHFLLDKTSIINGLTFAASASDPLSGRRLEVWTTEPGMQLFSGNIFFGMAPVDLGKDNRIFAFRGGFCMEPSHYPDSPNHPHFPSTTIKVGDSIKGKIIYKFFIE